MPVETIKVMIFEDRPDYREQLLSLVRLQEDMILVGSSGTTWNIVERVKRNEPDVILMDIEMPTQDQVLDDRAGIKSIFKLREALQVNVPKFIIISNYKDDDRIFEAFCAGGSISFLTKPVNAAELSSTIRNAMAGAFFSSPYIAARIRDLLGNPINKKNADLLSPRESEALTYLKQGYSQQETAELMGISSIKDLLKSIYRKLEVHNLRQAENKVWYNHLNILRWLRQ